MTPTPDQEQETVVTSRLSDQETVVTGSTATTVVKPNAKTVAAQKRRVTRRTPAGMFDTPEIVAVSLAGALLLGVLLTYLLWLVPARQDLERRAAQRNRLDRELTELREKAGGNRSKEATFTDLVGSVERFETVALPVASQGQASLYARLNDLIRVHGLRNTAGPDYAPLEMVSTDKPFNPKQLGSGNRQQSIFPGVYVTVTVEGGYSNLRRFISDIERSPQFVVVSAVDIESNETENTVGQAFNADAPVQPTKINFVAQDPAGIPGFSGVQQNPNGNPTRVNPRAGQNQPNAIPFNDAPGQMQTNPAPKRAAVSMRLEMAAYFRRSANLSR